MKQCFALVLFLVSASFSFAQSPEFERSVDMNPWSERVAVFTDGRVKSFETFARSHMTFIFGTRSFEGQPATFTYFDMMIRPERYIDRDIVYVKNKGLRAAIIGEVDTTEPALQERMNTFMKTGLVSREILQDSDVRTLLNRLRQDVMRFATPVEIIDGAIGTSDPRNLWAALRIVPPPNGSFDLPWSTLEGVTDADIIASWEKLVTGWQNENADVVNSEFFITPDPCIWIRDLSTITET